MVSDILTICNEEFLPPIVAYHFNANKLQDFIEDKLKTKVNIIHKNITSLDNIDGDYILNCMGKTKNEDEYNSIDLGFTTVTGIKLT